MGLKRAIRIRRQKLGAAHAQRKRRLVTRYEGRKEMRPAKPSFLRFAASSLACTTVDQLLAWLLFRVLRGPFAGAGFARILVSTIIARIASLTLNYVLNRRLVFSPQNEQGRRPRKRESLPKFVALAAVILTLSSIGVFYAHETFGIEEWQAKLVVDFLLFFLNYYGQQKWVFNTEATVRMR